MKNLSVLQAGIKDLINVQDYQGATPLHKAIRNEDISLAETLLAIDNISYNIKDNQNESALAFLCTVNDDWVPMLSLHNFFELSVFSNDLLIFTIVNHYRIKCAKKLKLIRE